jgi:hypothetical protein
MGIFGILLASQLLFPHGPERSNTSEDLEMGRRGEDLAADSGNDDTEQQSRDPVSNGDFEDDNDPDPQDPDEDEQDEPRRRRVTFGSPAEESRPPSENGDTKPGLSARIKAVVFPPRDEGKPSCIHSHRTLPIFSGLVIPFSILLEIPGLTDSWYVRTHENVVTDTQRNPLLLTVGLAFSMFFAVLANASLICRFLEKGPVLVTTLISIASLSIHGTYQYVPLRNFAPDCISLFADLINITAVVTFGVQHRFSDGFTYGQGYWMTGMRITSGFLVALTDGFSVLYGHIFSHQPYLDMGSVSDAKLLAEWYGTRFDFFLLR